jgi:hypothetical protein
MDDEYINQHDIALRYLQGKLTPEETVEFEEYILDKPKLLEQLEVDSVLKIHLPNVHIINTSSPKIRKPFGWFSTPLRASVATAFACVFILWVAVPKKEFSATHFTASPDIVYLETFRSAGNTQEISVDNSHRSILLVIDLSGLPEKMYSFKLFDQNEIERMDKNGLSTNSLGELIISLPTKVLNSGDYILLITSPDNQNWQRLFNLRIQAK